MESISLIRQNLRRSQSIVLSRVEDMVPHPFVVPESGGCHTLWIIGHLAYIESLVIHRFMRGLENPLADWESMFDCETVSKDPNAFESFPLVLRRCREIRDSTIQWIDSLTEQDLDRPSRDAPATPDGLFQDFRSCFQYCSDHWYMHRGQLAACRRAAGIRRMWY